MNAPTTFKLSNTDLDNLRLPFADHQISKLPKESRKQADERKAGNNVEWNCKVCGGMHHKQAVHLDYVGHAAATDRLLDTDIGWTWEPLALDQRGLPAFDQDGGLWIKLTVCGVTRLGYGHADGKTGGNAVKEAIGDAIRNAGMRFGMALDLWHKGELHLEAEEQAAGQSQGETQGTVSPPPAMLNDPNKSTLDAAEKRMVREIESCGDSDMLDAYLATKEAKADYTMLNKFRQYAIIGPHPDNLDGFIPIADRIKAKRDAFARAAYLTV